jgi:hypothetical protein
VVLEVLLRAPTTHRRPAVETPDHGVAVHDWVTAVPFRTKRRAAPDRRK